MSRPGVVRVEAGRLTHVDLGKTVEVPASGYAGELTMVAHQSHTVELWIAPRTWSLAVDPHTLVTITGKDTHDG
jgi:hypothetical protein